MSRKVRIILGLLILAISIALLIWGFVPARREMRVEPIPPAELQLPTPTSFRFEEMALPYMVSLSQPIIIS
jgi:hypothetical protein